MSLKTARALTGAYLVCALLALIWPGALPAARIRPLVLGLPFALFWPAVWIVGALVVLYLLDRVEARHRPGKNR